MKKLGKLFYLKLSQAKVLPVVFFHYFSKNQTINLVVIIIRLFNTLGSIVTGAFILLFLIQLGKSEFIPFMVIALATGRVLATKLIIPNINNKSHILVLMCTSIFDFLLLSLSAWIMFKNISSILLVTLILVTFFVATLSTIDEAFSASLLVTEEQSSRWLHSDSTLQILARVLGPGLSAWALTFFVNRNYSVFLIDGFSYFCAVIFYSILLFFNKPTINETIQAPHDKNLKLPFKQLWIKNTKSWKKLISTSFGAGAYNAGALIYLSKLQMPTTSIAIFMTAQNISMVVTSLALTAFPKFSKSSRYSPIISFIGLATIGLSTGIFYLCAGTVIMAFGMVLFIQSERVSLVQNTKFTNNRKEFIAFFITINSTIGATSVVFYTLLSSVISWKYSLLVGSLFLLIPAFVNFDKKWKL